MEPLKFGIIGCSRIAKRSVIPAIIKSEFAELEIIGSRSTDKAKEFASEFNCKKFGTYENVISDDSVDAIYISTPIGTHEEWSIKASEAGKHVYVEKSSAANFDSAQKLADDVMETFGSIDVVVNNAGITKDNLLMRMSEEDYDRVMEVNMKSVFNLTKAVLRPMLKQRNGSIINMSSVVGVKGNAGQANYAASKAAIIGFSKSTALELGSRNIRCNVIAPGFIETEMTATLNEDTVQAWRDSIPLKRGGTTEDIANATLYFASDMSAYVTGQVLTVCGGMLT